MHIPITLFFTGILGFVFFAHSMRTIITRRQTHTVLGNGDSDHMLRRIRTHGNFAEYVPFLLLILLLLELSEVSSPPLYAFGVAIVLGRLFHAYGLHSPVTPGWARTVGMQLTMWPLILGSFYLLYLSLV